MYGTFDIYTHFATLAHNKLQMKLCRYRTCGESHNNWYSNLFGSDKPFTFLAMMPQFTGSLIHNCGRFVTLAKVFPFQLRFLSLRVTHSGLQLSRTEDACLALTEKVALLLRYD